jgi:hypothetical protein
VLQVADPFRVEGESFRIGHRYQPRCTRLRP